MFKMEDLIVSILFLSFTIVIWFWIVFFSGANFLHHRINLFYKSNNPSFKAETHLFRYVYTPLSLKVISTISFLIAIYVFILSIKGV